MNVAVALVGITLGQPPAARATQDYYPLASRTIKLPIKYERDRKAIRQVKLYVARNGENTWYQESAVPPDRDSFSYFAKEDGIYWFTMVEEDLQGKNVPNDLTRTAPDLKVIVDTVPPRVEFTTRSEMAGKSSPNGYSTTSIRTKARHRFTFARWVRSCGRK